ncbi:hypothetical protein BKA70DRAFT_1239658 [Coprinopsis sp. MPI-PUGE-AT-0042]|nr:hypothetical protein BKA70DRAFT_1239658 [Coprinopsis sp. MPI-PUGE-AT-0042]
MDSSAYSASDASGAHHTSSSDSKPSKGVGTQNVVSSVNAYSGTSEPSVPDIIVNDQEGTSEKKKQNLTRFGMPTRRNIPFLSRASFHYRPPPGKETTRHTSDTGCGESVSQQDSKAADNMEGEVVVEE